MSAQAFQNGAAQAAGSNLTNAVLNTPQGQQAVQFTANTIAQSSAAVVGGVMMAGHAAAAAGAATVAGTVAVATVAIPVVAVTAAVAGVTYGVIKLCEWLDS